MADPIDVKAPNGDVVRFPAGTDDATINAAMAKEFGGAKAPAEMSYGDQMRHVGGAIDNVVRSVANGIPFMDRITAAGGAATGIGGTFGDYSGNLERERARNKSLEEASPMAGTAAHLVGGSLLPVGAFGAAAKGVGLLGKTLAGAGTGAAIGGVQGLSDTQDLTDVKDAAKNTTNGAILGGLIGGSIPTVAKGVGAAYSGLANAVMGTEGISRGAAPHLARAIEAEGGIPAVRARLDNLGPDAMMADAGDALLGKTQGASLYSDEGRATVGKALRDRNEGTIGRIRSDVDNAIGPYQGGDPKTIQGDIIAHRSNIDGINYPAALDNAPDVRTGHILSQIDSMIPRSPNGSLEQKALTKLHDMMMTTERRPLLDAHGYPQYDRLGNERWEEVPVSQNDAGVLHKVKVEMDRVIEHDEPGLGLPAGSKNIVQGSLKHLRGQINDALEGQVPGYAEANAASSALAKRATAVGEGTEYLGSGKTTPSPERFAAEFAHKPGQTEPRSIGEQIAFAKGSRGEIERILGTKSNDLQALRGELQGEGGWNTAKLATVHGQDAVDQLTGSVDRNLKFRDTYNKVVENSQTMQRKAALDGLKPSEISGNDIINPNGNVLGMTLTALKRGSLKATNALLESSRLMSRSELAKVLTAQGPQRDQYLSAMADALSRRQGNAVTGAKAGNPAALAAALLANGYARSGQSQPR